jgi:hypothetical protein
MMVPVWVIPDPSDFVVSRTMPKSMIFTSL